MSMRASQKAVTLTFLLVLSALPAEAGVEIGSVVLSGTATVGNQASPNPLPQSGQCTVTGKGLHAPGFHGGFKQKGLANLVVVDKQLYYRVAIPDVNAMIVDTDNPLASGAYTGTLNVCGIVSTGELGIGAACGYSSGQHGKGKLILTHVNLGNVRVYDIHDVEWEQAVGGLLPITGRIHRVSADKTTKFTSKGHLMGIINAQGAGPCFTGPKQDPAHGGATAFTVNGVVVAEALTKEPNGKPNTPKLPK